MRVYNGKSSQVDMPLANGQRITIAPLSVSGDIMPSNEFLSLMVTSYDYTEIALIVSGPFEINMCSQVSCCAGFVVSSLEEAIERFASPADKTVNPANLIKEDEKKVCETPEEITTEKPKAIVEPVEEKVVEATKKPSSNYGRKK